MKYVVWGAPGAGKTSIAGHIGIPDRFHGDEALAEVVFESRGADLALLVFDVTVPAQVQAARSQVASRQAGIGEPPAFVPVSARFGDLILHPGNRIDWYAGPTLAELLGIPEQVAA